VVHASFDGRPTRVLTRLVSPATIDPAALPSRPRARAGTPGTALPAQPKVMPAPPVGRPAPQRLSYTALGQYARCPYRFYLQRTLRLPPVAPPLPPDDAEPQEAPALDARVRGVIAHRLLEELDFARPAAPPPDAVLAVAAEEGAELSPEDVEDLRAIVAAFGASPLCARVAAAASVRREAPFAFPLDPAGGALVTGVVDVFARAADGRVLVVDYKSDRLGEAEPDAVVARDYATQRVVYALAALRDGAPEVDVAYAFLERPDAPVTETFTVRDVPALAERLTNLAEGVLEGRHPVAAEPHRALCGDCPGRATLCSWPESMTLREPAQASAGTLAGSGGPS
jgi:ATP-dependent helicase/nuclease subunit A